MLKHITAALAAFFLLLPGSVFAESLDLSKLGDIEEAEQWEILRPDGPAVTTLLLKRLLDRILASSAKDYGIQVTENQQNLLFAEVYHYTDYLIERMMKEALKNGSDREAKE